MSTSDLFNKNRQTHHGKRTRVDEVNDEQAPIKLRKSILNQAPTLLRPLSFFKDAGITSTNNEKTAAPPMATGTTTTSSFLNHNSCRYYSKLTGSSTTNNNGNSFTEALISSSKVSQIFMNHNKLISNSSSQNPKDLLSTTKPPITELREQFQQSKISLRSSQRVKSIRVSKIGGPFNVSNTQPMNSNNQSTLTNLRWKMKRHSFTKSTQESSKEDSEPNEAVNVEQVKNIQNDAQCFCDENKTQASLTEPENGVTSTTLLTGHITGKRDKGYFATTQFPNKSTIQQETKKDTVTSFDAAPKTWSEENDEKKSPQIDQDQFLSDIDDQEDQNEETGAHHYPCCRESEKKSKLNLPNLLIELNSKRHYENNSTNHTEKQDSKCVFEENSSLSSLPTTACIGGKHYLEQDEALQHRGHRRRTSTLKDIDNYFEDYCHARISEERLYSQPLLSKESHLLLSSFGSTKSLMDIDYAGYGHFWYIYQRHREHLFQPWQLTLSGKMEKLRLNVTAMYWESMKYHPISLSTIYVAIGNFNRLLSSWSASELEHPTPVQWALTAVVAYRLAFKLEERPEILWEVNNFWDLFPMFSEWSIDRSATNMNKAEMVALNILNDEMDLPLAPMFLSLYLSAGGWPEAITKQYYDLAMYILGVVTFASVKDHLLRSVVPSTIAVAALVLAIKIVNGDRSSPSGVLSHLADCPRSSFLKSGQLPECSCRYEFFPERLKQYCNMQLSEVLPVIRGLCNLLRSKPEEAYALKYSFPMWGEHDWR